MSNIDLSVIIVSWRVKELLLITLKSLFKSETNINFEVIVIDNASNDGSVEAVRLNFPNVKLLANEKNLGFAAACCQGVDISQGKYFLFLNDDTEVFPDTLEKIYNFLTSKPNLGVVGGKILNPDLSTQSSVRRFPQTKDLLFILLKLPHIFPALTNNYLYINFNYDVPAKVDQVMGAFFATTREVWNKLNGFDKKYFIWFEEVDFCWRAKQSGYVIYYEPSARIIHHRGASFKQLLALPEQRLFNRSLFYYVKKNISKFDYYILKIFEPVSILLALIVQLLEKNKKNV